MLFGISTMNLNMSMGGVGGTGHGSRPRYEFNNRKDENAVLARRSKGHH